MEYLECLSGFSDNQFLEIRKRYAEPHRHFHTFAHVQCILELIDRECTSEIQYPDYALAAIYHDIVYNPHRNDNEEESIKFMKEHLPEEYSWRIPSVASIIMDTKVMKSNSQFNSWDRKVLEGSIPQLIDYGMKIWKEYSHCSYSAFISVHTKIVQELVKTNKYTNYENVDVYLEYMKSRKPKVAIYPGSFNPLHKGHKNVIQQASNIFEKVILARGFNPSKSDFLEPINKDDLFGVEVISFDGMLADLVQQYSSQYDVTVVKGVRNGKDLDSEMEQIFFSKNMNKDMKYILIPCDEEYRHISSSAIRSLLKFGKDVSKYV